MATSEQATDNQQPKRPRLECIIHCSDDTDKLVSPQIVDSWKTLLRAAQIRNHAPILDLARDTPEGEIPAICYHRKCRSIFTMKKTLDGILAKDEQSVSGSAEEKDSRAARRSQVHLELMTQSAPANIPRDRIQETTGAMSRTAS